jgi:[acyl-carrier-protein] S-malonyltransferase
MINNGTRRFIEIGAGKVLTGLTRRIDKNINCKSVETPHDIEDILTSLIKDKEVL